MNKGYVKKKIKYIQYLNPIIFEATSFSHSTLRFIKKRKPLLDKSGFVLFKRLPPTKFSDLHAGILLVFPTVDSRISVLLSHFQLFHRNT